MATNFGSVERLITLFCLPLAKDDCLTAEAPLDAPVTAGEFPNVICIKKTSVIEL